MKALYFNGKEMLEECDGSIEKIYHYTSPEGLVSIIKNKKIWFSDSQFMNDRSEYVYIKEIFEEAAKGTEHETDDKKMKNNKFLDYILGFPYEGIMPTPVCEEGKVFSKGLISTRYYLFCTSLNQDSLSLWNYYVKNKYYQGYNIGLDVNHLVKAISKNSLCRVTHGLVSYDRDMQIRKLHEKIVELDQQYKADVEKCPNDEHHIDICIDNYQENLADYLIKRCLFYKNPAFSHEQEYRFVIEAPKYNSEKEHFIDYHIGIGGLIVPHLELSFDMENVLKNITLAPMMESVVAKQGVNSLLANNTQNSQKIKIETNYSSINVRF